MSLPLFASPDPHAPTAELRTLINQYAAIWGLMANGRIDAAAHKEPIERHITEVLDKIDSYLRMRIFPNESAVDE